MVKITVSELITRNDDPSLQIKVNEVNKQLKSVKKSKVSIDGLHVTSWQTCWRYNTKEYFIIAIVGSSRRGRALLSVLSHEIDCKRRILSQANIDKRGLNKYGLHLNRAGTALLAKNMIMVSQEHFLMTELNFGILYLRMCVIRIH